MTMAERLMGRPSQSGRAAPSFLFMTGEGQTIPPGVSGKVTTVRRVAGGGDGCFGGRKIDQQLPVRHPSARPSRDLGGGGDSASGRSSGVLGSCAERGADRPYDCIAERVARVRPAGKLPDILSSMTRQRLRGRSATFGYASAN